MDAVAVGLSKSGLEADGRDRRRAGRRRHGLEVAQLALHVAAQLGTVVPLELAELGDAGLQARPLALELRELFAAAGLGVGDDRRSLGVGVGDERVALREA